MTSKTAKKLSNFADKTYSQNHENALDPSYYVKAEMSNGEWHLARIIDCRLAKDYDPKKKRTDYSYEYYVHYKDFNRRMDEWIPRSRIELTRELLEEELLTKKKKKVEEHRPTNNVDDEHVNLNSKSITHLF